MKPFLLLLIIAGTDMLAAANKKDLAKVAILTFEDETGTKNFGYMPASLSEAIDKSLQKRFEYVREEPAKSEAARKAIKPNGLLTAREAAEYCYRNGVHILVFGKFQYDTVSKQIVVATYISLGSETKFRGLKERRNATDSTIFALADKVADDIVAEMTLIANEQDDKNKSTKKSDEKLELQREIPVFWSFKNYALNLGLGFTFPESENLKSAYDGGGALDLSAKRILWRGLFAAGRAGLFRLDPKSGDLALTAIPGTLGVGYVFFLASDRWRFDIDLGGGYYGASVASNSLTAQRYSGGVVRITFGLHWLMFQNISLGFELSGMSLFAENISRQQITILTIGAGYIF